MRKSKKFFPVLLLLTLFAGPVLAQEDLTVIGDSLVGRRIDGNMIREVIGNVIITHEDVVINCNIAIQYLDENMVELIGDVVITKDTVKILTDRGFYYGDTKTAFSEQPVTLDDGHMVLNAGSGYYYAETDLAHFYNDVELIDSLSTLTSKMLEYFQKSNKAVAVGDVMIADTASVIFSDSLIHFRDSKESFAYGSVKVVNPENDLTIVGDTLVDTGERDYTKVTGDPVLAQVDTASDGTKDTLLISSKMMEAVEDSVEKLLVTDSVKIVRGEFASINDKAILYREENIIFLNKSEDQKKPPVLWYDNSQLIGDTVYIHIKDNKLDFMDIRQNALLVSKVKGYDFRFDQMSGERMLIYFRDGDIYKTVVTGGVLSIYYMFDNEDPKGLIKSSGENATIFFENNQVSEVNLYGSPASEFHPDNLVKGNEKEFTLPTFILYGDRPTRDDVLSKLNPGTTLEFEGNLNTRF